MCRQLAPYHCGHARARPFLFFFVLFFFWCVCVFFFFWLDGVCLGEEEKVQPLPCTSICPPAAASALRETPIKNRTPWAGGAGLKLLVALAPRARV